MLTNPQSRRWVTLLSENLSTSHLVMNCSKEEFVKSPTLQLAGEALAIRVGDLAKKIMVHEPSLGGSKIWQSAARTRDFLAHHYHQIDIDILWETVTISFGELTVELEALTSDKSTL